MNIDRPLYNFDSEEHAFYVDDYPYSFSIRTQYRCWLERKDGKGFRFVSQTRNPKKVGTPWNKPKVSTYVKLAGCLYLDEKHHVNWSGLSEYSEPNDILAFVKNFSKAEFSILKLYLPMKVLYCQRTIDGKANLSINGVPCVPTTCQIEEAEADIKLLKEAQSIIQCSTP